MSYYGAEVKYFQFAVPMKNSEERAHETLFKKDLTMPTGSNSLLVKGAFQWRLWGETHRGLPVSLL